MITEFEPERLLAGVGNRAETEAAEGVVLLLPDLFGSFLFQFAAGALVDLNLLRCAFVEPPPQMGFQLMISRSREAP